MVGPGLLAGLSDDDPAGITTYSILGAKYGYELLWVLALSTAALIVFHELGVRLGHRHRQGPADPGPRALRRPRRRAGALGAWSSPIPAPSAPSSPASRPAMELLSGMSRYVSVPLAAVGVSALVLRESFRHVEHFLLALSSVFIAYVISGVLAHPDWGAAAKGLVVPSIPLNREALLVAVATVGTTLAPWGLAFIQSYAVDKRLQVKDLRYERVDVIVGAVLTGVIGFFVVDRLRGDAARPGHRRQRRQRRGAGARTAGGGHGGDPLRARLPRRRPARRGDRAALHRLLDLRDPRPQGRPQRQLQRGARPSTSASAPSPCVAASIVLIPGAPLIPILFLSQALNAVLLLVLLPFMRSLGKDRELMGEHALGRADRWATGIALAVIAASVLALGVLTVL